MTRRLLIVVSALLTVCSTVMAQDKPAAPKPADPQAAERPGSQYSGMYSFLKEGEFVQLTVEDAGHVTGFVSRFGDSESDKGAFLDQFFKTGKLDGDSLSFTTEIVHGMAYEFKGTISRGEGKKPGDEAYYQIKGTLTEHLTDANQKTSSRTREVTFKAFPAEPS
jgi:hypothetical protein